MGRGIAPAGASRGAHEAIDKRDGGKRLGGLDVQDALEGIRTEIAARSRRPRPVRSGRDRREAHRPRRHAEQSKARRKRADRGVAGGAARGGREPRSAALALLPWRRAGDHSAAGNPDLRRRRPCRPADRRPGLHGRRPARQDLRRGAGGHGERLPRRGQRSWPNAASCKASPTRAAGGRPSRPTRRRSKR